MRVGMKQAAIVPLVVSFMISAGTMVTLIVLPSFNTIVNVMLDGLIAFQVGYITFKLPPLIV